MIQAPVRDDCLANPYAVKIKCTQPGNTLRTSYLGMYFQDQKTRLGGLAHTCVPA